VADVTFVMAEWMLDMFANLYDVLELRVSEVEDLNLAYDPVDDSLAASFRDSDGLPSAELEKLIGRPVADGVSISLPIETAYRILISLDKAMKDLTPNISGHYDFNNKLNKSTSGIVLPKLPGNKPQSRGQRLSNGLEHLLRYSNSGVKISRRKIHAKRPFTAGNKLIIACCPLADDEDCEFNLVGDQFFDVQIKSGREPQLIARAIDALRRAVTVKADILILPELVSSKNIVDAIREELRSAAFPGHPWLVLAGTYLVSNTPRPRNQATLINQFERSTNILLQNKMHRFRLDRSEQERLEIFPLDARDQNREEGTTISPRELVLLEVDFKVGGRTKSWRIGTLICEDFAQPFPGGEIVMSLGIDLVLVPVMSDALIEGRWTHTIARYYAEQTPVWSVIVNSLVMSRRAAKGKKLVSEGIDATDPLPFAQLVAQQFPLRWKPKTRWAEEGGAFSTFVIEL
jgi:predicted amidohydrolase